VAGDEVYGNNPSLRSFCETRQIGYVLRVASNFHLTAGDGRAVTAGQLLKTRTLGKRNRWWQVRSAGAGSKGERLYKWAWIGVRVDGQRVPAPKFMIFATLDI